MKDECFRINGKIIRLPAFFPVISPSEGNYTVEYRVRTLLPHVCEGVLISAYHFVKNPSIEYEATIKTILNNCFVFIDSGGFLVQDYDENTSKIVFNEFVSDWKNIFHIQNRLASIANNVDLVKISEDTEKTKIRSTTSKLIRGNLHFTNLYMSVKKRFLFFPTVHAHIPELLRASCDNLKKYTDSINGISVGGLVYLKNDWRKIINRLIYVKSIFNHIPIHAFGIGNPALVPVLFSLGVKSIDSSSYIKYSLNYKFIHPTSLRLLDLTKLPNSLPCNCDICKNFSKQDLLNMGNMGKAYLSIHNLLVYMDLVKTFQEEDGDPLNKLLKVNPQISKCAKYLKKQQCVIIKI